MKSYTITVNGNVYDVTVEENGAVSAPAAAPRRAAAPAPAAAPAGTPPHGADPRHTSATFHCRSGNRPSPDRSRAGRSRRPACAPETPGCTGPYWRTGRRRPAEYTGSVRPAPAGWKAVSFSVPAPLDRTGSAGSTRWHRSCPAWGQTACPLQHPTWTWSTLLFGRITFCPQAAGKSPASSWQPGGGSRRLLPRYQ